MQSRDFVFWLQGYLEVSTAGGKKPELNAEQLACVQKHLALVFEHEIDPSAGKPAHQAALNEIHHGPGPKPVMRC
jgi:hypothetical protein